MWFDFRTLCGGPRSQNDYLELASRFHTVVLADGTQVALKTDPVVREGQSPAGETTAKVGGAAIGGGRRTSPTAS